MAYYPSTGNGMYIENQIVIDYFNFAESNCKLKDRGKHNKH